MAQKKTHKLCMAVSVLQCGEVKHLVMVGSLNKGGLVFSKLLQVAEMFSDPLQ